jgi:hypothetical protein
MEQSARREIPPSRWGISRKGVFPVKDLEPLADIITLTLYTAYIQNVQKPNSLLIIARPESGKTELMKKFIVNKNIAYVSDLTAFGLERDYLPKIETGEIRHIMIPDLLKPLSRKESTVNTLSSNPQRQRSSHILGVCEPDNRRSYSPEYYNLPSLLLRI